MLIEHKEFLSLESERVAQGSDNLSPAARYSCLTKTVTHFAFVLGGRGFRPAGFEGASSPFKSTDNFLFIVMIQF